LPAIRVDANQLELALLNVAVNARDAMPISGVLTVTARAEECAAGQAPNGLAPGRYVRLSVHDTGIGMDEATLARATEPFFTTKGPGKGTGLGLSMVHGLAVQSGGAMRLSSKVGAGTTIDLWLPIAAGGAPSLRGDNDGYRASGAAPCEPKMILLVDDDPLVLGGTAAMLEDLGHVVIEANSGEQALSVLAADRRFDLVITDHAMPGMTGADLAGRIRTGFPDLPIVLASGYADLPTVEDSSLALPRLEKPLLQQDLAAAIASACKPRSNVISLRGR
jgi:CheY-like chemotaxis protein